MMCPLAWDWCKTDSWRPACLYWYISCFRRKVLSYQTLIQLAQHLSYPPKHIHILVFVLADLISSPVTHITHNTPPAVNHASENHKKGVCSSFSSPWLPSPAFFPQTPPCVCLTFNLLWPHSAPRMSGRLFERRSRSANRADSHM